MDRVASKVAEQLKVAGTRIRFRFNPAVTGESLGRLCEEDDVLLCEVQFPGRGTRWEPVQELELADEVLSDKEVIAEGRFARAGLFRRKLTAMQLGGQLSELIYSLDMTNTEFMPHQFKPLLALLDSPSRGILIADEVGLGKTIEAGLIWTELRFRTSASTMLVVCPAMLTEKWKDELARRFGTASRIISAADMIEWLDSPRRESAPQALICSLQGLRPRRGWDDPKEDVNTHTARLARKLADFDGETLFDLTVIDEAHYLRNEETASADLGRLLRPVSDYLVLLSATPVNTRSEDLFNLVSLVDPQQFAYRTQFDDVLEANRPLVRAANLLRVAGTTPAQIREQLEIATDSWMLEESAGLASLRESIARMDPDATLAPEMRVEVNQELDRINLLGRVVTRTRKREAFPNRVERKVSRVAAPMTEAEAKLYEIVTGAVRSYALESGGVEGFLLAMPERQMSSSMYAAAKRWLGANAADGVDAELAYEEAGLLEVPDSRPISAYVAARVAGKVDLAELRSGDSKVQKLLQLLESTEHLRSTEKVLVFSYFRDTLAYLKERLSEAGIRAMIVQGGDEKHARIEEFKRSPAVRVLLASEVAAEGVDLQFMRVMVNYDLPWNPMRIEQRIGRIDRIGQGASAISVFNLVYQDTIDDRIVHRLYERLNLFTDSIGCTEEVLGSSISELTRDLLSATLTPEQELQRADATEVAIAQRKKDLAIVEANECELVGLGDFVRERVVRAHQQSRHISDEDLLAHIREYLDEAAPGYQLTMGTEDPMKGTLRLPGSAAVRLQEFRESHRLPRSRLESGNSEPIRIRNRVDGPVGEIKVELINQFHPLVRLSASSLDGPRPSVLFALRLAHSRAEVAAATGLYAFAAEAWVFAGVREDRSVQGVFVPLDDGPPIDGDAAFDLLNLLRTHGRDWVDAADQLHGLEPDSVLDLARRKLRARFVKYAAKYRAENDDRVRIQLHSIEQNFARRRAAIQSRIDAHILNGRKPLEKADREQLRRLEERAEAQLDRVRGRQVVDPQSLPLVEGFLRVVA